MSASQIVTRFPGECAATDCRHFKRAIKSGKRALYDGTRIYHEDCTPLATQPARTIGRAGQDYFTSGQYDRDEEPEV